MQPNAQLLDEDVDAGRGFPSVIKFPSGLPGFPHVHEFSISPLGPGMEPFLKMECLDQPGILFVVVPPGDLYGDYSARIDEEHIEGLDLTRAEDAGMVAIVTLATPPSLPTVNLLGPVVINLTNGFAAQVVQHGSDFSVATPIPTRQSKRTA